MTEEEKYCETCNHIEMCKWTPISGCAFHSKYEQRPHGKWIVHSDKIGLSVECPLCHKEMAGDDLNYCCKCGADMKGD